MVKTLRELVRTNVKSAVSRYYRSLYFAHHPRPARGGGFCARLCPTYRSDPVLVKWLCCCIWLARGLDLYRTHALLCYFQQLFSVRTHFRYFAISLEQQILAKNRGFPLATTCDAACRFRNWLCFLFAPTGLGVRVATQFFGFDPNAQTVDDLALLIKDPHALGLIIMLAIKETPFLLLMSIPILQQLNVDKIEKVSHSMGYSTTQTWWKCIFPQWLAKLRFPMLAVIAYSLSVVDIALIIGPTNPPTFAVLVWQWFNDPDLALWPRAASGAVILFAIATGLIGLTRFVEWLVTKGFKRWQYSGRSGLKLPGKVLFSLITLLTFVIVPLMVLWSFAQRWRFRISYPVVTPYAFGNMSGRVF